jgi:glucokinase
VSAAIGIDVGATKIVAGRVDVADGRLYDVRERLTPAGPRESLAACADMVDGLSQLPLPVGLGICELVSPEGEITSGVSVDWRGLDIEGSLRAGPVRIEADVRAAAAAEARYGAAAGASSALYLNVGSGISHCLVVDGRPLAGARGNAIITGAPPVERWSSGLGLARHAGTDRAEAVLADPAQAALVKEAADRLGAVLATLINALDPDLVVIGGGLGMESSYRELIVAATRPLVYSPATASLPIVPAVLGARAGLVGAGALAADDARVP